jgi:hypothetical protein
MGGMSCHADPALREKHPRSFVEKTTAETLRCPSAVAHASTSLSVPEQRRRERREQSRIGAQRDRSSMFHFLR